MLEETSNIFMGQVIQPGDELGVYTETIFNQMQRHWNRNELEEYDSKLTSLFAGDRTDINLAKHICDLIGRTR